MLSDAPLWRLIKDLDADRKAHADQVLRGISDYTKYREIVARVDTIDRVLVRLREVHHTMFEGDAEE